MAPSAATCSSGPRCWYFRAGFGLLGMKDGKSLVRAGDNRYHAIFMTDGDALFVSPSSLAVALIALDGQATIRGPKGERTVKVAELYQVPKARERQRADGPARRGPHQGDDPGGQGEECLVRGPAEAGAGLAAGAGLGQPDDGRRHASRPPGSSSTASRRSPGGARRPREAITGKRVTPETAAAAGEAAVEGAAPAVDERLQGPPDQDRRQAGPARGPSRQALLGGGVNSAWIPWPRPNRTIVRPSTTSAPPCRHLRSQRHVYLRRRRRPRGTDADDYESSAYWCSADHEDASGPTTTSSAAANAGIRRGPATNRSDPSRAIRTRRLWSITDNACESTPRRREPAPGRFLRRRRPIGCRPAIAPAPRTRSLRTSGIPTGGFRADDAAASNRGREDRVTRAASDRAVSMSAIAAGRGRSPGTPSRPRPSIASTVTDRH